MTAPTDAELVIYYRTLLEAANKRADQAEAALAPFAALAASRAERYRKRGGNVWAFPESHPSFDIIADDRELPIGVWRAAVAAIDRAREAGNGGR